MIFDLNGGNMIKKFSIMFVLLLFMLSAGGIICKKSAFAKAAPNSDNEYIYLDGVARIADKPLSELGDIFASMEKLEKDFGVKFVLTCSSSKEDLPDFILKWAK